MNNFNNLKLGIVAIGLVSCVTCHAQNGLMLTTIADFYGTNGAIPIGQLVQGSDGLLYGVTGEGGDFGVGTVFKTTLSGSVTTLLSFNGTNGAYPSSAPIQAADGYFYGTTANGGPDWNTTNGEGTGYGTIYRMDSNGVLTTLFSFNQTNGDGPGVESSLISGSDGALYGVTELGGPNFTNINGGDGTVFKITTTGDFTPLASFDGTNGYVPINLIEASDGNFYGTTHYGGIDDTHGLGTVFRMTPDGQITTLLRFNGANGSYPEPIMQASDGSLYGMTSQGGSFYTGAPDSGFGTIFQLTTNGDFTLLASFDMTNGAQPFGGLTEVTNGVFYGTTGYGGLYPSGPGFEYNDGTFFQVTTNSDLTVFFSFGADSLLPSNPDGTLTRASDGNYYGPAQGPNSGSVFSIRQIQAPVLQPSLQGSQLNLSWNAWAGYPYNLMYETNLSGSNWTLLSTITPQTNGIASYSDNIGPDAQRFYTVVLQLP